MKLLKGLLLGHSHTFKASLPTSRSHTLKKGFAQNLYPGEEHSRFRSEQGRIQKFLKKGVDDTKLRTFREKLSRKKTKSNPKEVRAHSPHYSWIHHWQRVNGMHFRFRRSVRYLKGSFPGYRFCTKPIF